MFRPLSVFILSLLALLFPADVRAQYSGPRITIGEPCPQWRVPRPLTAIQNNGFWATFYLQQDGERIFGRAGYKIGNRVVVGDASGRIRKDLFTLRVLWTRSGVNSIGVYNGKIDVAGIIRNGSTIDEAARPVVATGWQSKEALFCPQGTVKVEQPPAPVQQTPTDTFVPRHGINPGLRDTLKAR